MATPDNLTPAFVLVDDDDDDRLLMRMALNQTGISLPIVELADGTELITYLAEELVEKGDSQVLWLVIMDINMPIMNGTEALQIMQQHTLWRQVPVLMLSTSDDPKHVHSVIQLGATGYMTKPSSYHGYIPPIKATFSSWL